MVTTDLERYQRALQFWKDALTVFNSEQPLRVDKILNALERIATLERLIDQIRTGNSL